MRSTQDTGDGSPDAADPSGAQVAPPQHPAAGPASASMMRRAFSLAAGAAGRLLVVASLAGLAAGGGWLVTQAATPPSSATTSTIPGLDIKAARVAPGSEAPVQAEPAGGRTPAGEEASGAGEADEAAPSQPPRQGSAADMLRAWAERAEPVVGVPARALVAYGRAELTMRAAQPDCRLSWATLAGIGRIESNHGRYGGAVLGSAGYPSDPIVGVPLDGSPGVAKISDTDNGVYDGDRAHDRAVGPMQFIPSTWTRWASDGNGDGVGSPQQVDDAALAAARYLCAGGRDMGTAEGWWQGVLSYNQSVQYAKKVFAVAETYANRAGGITAS